jgi:hypothetical protein
MISNDKVTIAVPAALLARAGYLDAAIMSYVDVQYQKRNGSLQLKTKWNTRTEFLVAFTFKEIPKSYLTTQTLSSHL